MIPKLFSLPNIKQKDIDRFWDKVLFTTDCWEWQGWKIKTGYGQFKLNYKNLLTHRVSYILNKGDIKDGLYIDHLCKNPSCVNPDHLELVSHKENTMRGNNMASLNAKKTHCKRGHELKGDNLYIRPKNNQRRCSECRRIADRNYYKRDKELTKIEK